MRRREGGDGDDSTGEGRPSLAPSSPPTPSSEEKIKNRVVARARCRRALTNGLPPVFGERSALRIDLH